MAYDDQNIFAKILRGELPAQKVYEDQHTLAFMDIMPQVAGHTLVIAKYPAETIMDLPPEHGAYLMSSVQKVAAAVQTAMNAQGIVILQLNGRKAGQTVPHAHFHILAGSIGDLSKAHAHTMGDMAEIAAYAARIRAALA